MNLVLGALGGALAAVLTHPIDVIKTRIMTVGPVLLRHMYAQTPWHRRTLVTLSAPLSVCLCAIDVLCWAVTVE